MCLVAALQLALAPAFASGPMGLTETAQNKIND